jgi:SpoVK/Ycf46/Vps4 family AAA+-type ATPase
MNPELLNHLRSLTRCIYYVTEEEDRAILELKDVLSKFERRTWVYSAIQGMVPISAYVTDWKAKTLTSSEHRTIHQSLEAAFKDDPRDEQNYYIVTDPEKWFKDELAVRRVLQIVHQLHQDDTTIKVLIFVSNRLFIPNKLRRYIEVVTDQGLSLPDIQEMIENAQQKIPNIRMTGSVEEVSRQFLGLTSYEVDAAISQSVVATKKDENNPKRIDAGLIAEYKRRQIRKSGLLDFIDVGEYSFDQVGGHDRFKAWVNRTQACWTSEGQKFGLQPPKGVLAVGVYGCGKSLCVKCLANAWGVPMVPFEMGRLRSSAVGESEANVYSAIRLIEAVAPCVVWLDEAEKSLAGNSSSGQSDAGTTSRMIGILSTWLQETNAPVCLAMTANSLTLPPEFVNRMDERFFFDLPAEDERMEILKIHMQKRNQDPKKFQLADLAEASSNMVGREIEQSIVAALVTSFEAKKDGLDHDILLEELERKPRIFKTMVDELQQITDWVGYDEEHDEGIRARFSSSVRNEHFKRSR